MSSERSAAVHALLTAIDAKRNLPLGIAGGVVAAVLGAVAWAVVTAVTHYEIGYLAIGVAFLVGFAMRNLGHGRTKTFGYAGGALSLLGAILGNFLAIYGLVAADQHLSASDVLAMPFAEISAMFRRQLGPMDLFFFGLAAYFGYRYSIRTLTKDEIATLPA